jgi:integrase
VDLNKVSLRTQLKSLRVFIKWCESIDAVEQELHEKILLPTPSKEEEHREETLRTGQAEDVLQYLRRFEYASRTHALLELLWHSGLRIGAVYSLDIDDYDAEEDRLELTHRPETGTALKNKTEGERMVALSRYVCEVLDDYIDHNRLDVIDDHDRGPLFIDVEPSCDSVVKWVRLEPGRWAIRRAVSGPTSLWRAVSTILWRAVSTISYGRAKKERLL